jgi:hypothetical protein
MERDGEIESDGREREIETERERERNGERERERNGERERKTEKGGGGRGLSSAGAGRPVPRGDAGAGPREALSAGLGSAPCFPLISARGWGAGEGGVRKLGGRSEGHNTAGRQLHAGRPRSGLARHVSLWSRSGAEPVRALVLGSR